MSQYTDEELNAVWNKGKVIEGQNPNLVYYSPAIGPLVKLKS